MTEVVLAALGNSLRHDDGAGPAVARYALRVAKGTLRTAVVEDNPLRLLEVFDDVCRAGPDSLLIVVDAISSGRPPGTVRLIWLGADASTAAAAAAPNASSTHGLGFAQAYRLAGSLGVLPARVALVGVEGADFSRGEGLTPEVEAALRPAASLVVSLAKAALCGARPATSGHPLPRDDQHLADHVGFDGLLGGGDLIEWVTVHRQLS